MSFYPIPRPQKALHKGSAGDALLAPAAHVAAGAPRAPDPAVEVDPIPGREPHGDAVPQPPGRTATWWVEVGDG